MRTNKEIEEEHNKAEKESFSLVEKSRILKNDIFKAVQNKIMIEVLLDIRDLLKGGKNGS